MAIRTYVPADEHRQVKQAAVAAGVPIEQFARDALAAHVRRQAAGDPAPDLATRPLDELRRELTAETLRVVTEAVRPLEGLADAVNRLLAEVAPTPPAEATTK